MTSIIKYITISVILAAMAFNPVLAEQLEKPLSIEKRLTEENSLPTLRQGGAHGSKSPHSRLSPEMHVQVALQHKAEGRMGEAFRSLDLAIRRNPMSAELFAVRGSFYLERQNVSAALRDFESALKISPDSAAVLTNRAQAYRHFGRINEALNDLNKAIELKPGMMAAHFNRGAIHYSSSDFELALNDFDSCIAIDPHAAGPYFNRASARDALGDRTGAIEDIKRFIEIAGNSSWKDTAEQLLQKWESADPADASDNNKS